MCDVVCQEFLSSNKIIHRDLATRNILICGSKKTVKIADFGLSRDVYEQNCYKKKTQGMLPFKWLALECTLQDVFTTKSDV
jgi:tyrosine-protein kinase receptor torso